MRITVFYFFVNFVSHRSKIQGLGLYAARDLEKGQMIIEYIGEVIRYLCGNFLCFCLFDPLPFLRCWGSVTFWCGSGSGSPNHSPTGTVLYLQS
jgi:hypothetical protein